MAFSFSLELLVVSVFLLKTGLSGMIMTIIHVAHARQTVKLDQESQSTAM